MVELRPITDANFRAVLALDVLPEQRAFVAPAVESLAEAYAYPDAEAQAVYRGEELVGLVLFHPIEKDRPSEGHRIVRFMIDHRFQGQGLGREGLRAAVDWIVREHRVDTVRLSVVAENAVARALYRSEGFAENGELDHDELVMVKRIRHAG